MSLSIKKTDKQNRVPRSGKGKYNVTVPRLFSFQRKRSVSKTLRQEWLENEIRE